jgi:hypothetical protein
VRSDTPRVDGAFPDILAAPPETLGWLRGIERRLDKALAELRAVPDEPLPVVSEARDECTEFLDSVHSVFHRTLRRAVTQLGPSAPARERLNQVATDLLARARTAIEVQAAARPLLALARELEGYAARLPTFTARLLDAKRLKLEHIQRLRRVAEVDAAMARAITVRGRLEELSSAVPTDVGEDREQTPHPVGELTRDEIRALHELRTRRRSLIDGSHSVTGEIRRTFLSHLRQLAGDAEPRAIPGRAGPETFVTSQLLRRSMDSDAAGMPSDQIASIAALSANRLPADAIPATPVDAQTEVGENALYVSPIGEGFVHITNDRVSAVRVWTAGIRLGANVECQPVPILHGGIDRATAEMDLAPLFTGLEPGQTSWYKTRRRLQVRVTSQEGQGWFGKIVHQGIVEQIAGNPWSPTHESPTAFRLAGDDNSLFATPKRPLSASRGGVLWEFLGVQAEIARVPVPGYERCIRKVPTTRARELSESVRAEEVLFEALYRKGNPPMLPNGLVPVGDALVQGTTVPRPVYLMPDALTRQESPPVQAWIRSSVTMRVGAVRSVARVLSAVHETGYALGAIHLDAFAFGITGIGSDGAIKPGAMLVSAPWAVRLGMPFTAADQADSGLLFDHLRLRYIPFDVRQGLAATRRHDAFCFALFMLDVLAERSVSTTEVTWSGSGDQLQWQPDRFMLPVLVRAVADAMSDPADGSTRLLELIGLLAAPGPLREVDLIEKLEG